MRSSLLLSLRALTASSSLSLGSPAAGGLCAAWRPASLTELVVPTSCSAPAVLCSARGFSGGASGGGGGGGSGSPAAVQDLDAWMPRNVGELDALLKRRDSARQRQQGGAARPGAKAWMSAAWTALELSAIKNLKVEDEIGLLLSKAERLRRQEQEADIDALFDKELARLTNLPFAAFDILPRLLAAGYCDTALRMALAAYDKQVGSMGRSDEDAVVAGIPLGIALAAAHRHNEARPLLHDGLIVAYPRTQQLAAIKASLFDMSGRRGWRQTLANRAWAELAPVSKLWNAMFSEAGFYHVLSQIMESRYELERTWKSSGCQAEVKAKLDSLTRALKGLTNELGPEHVRVQCALREYGRAVASPQLKRHRQLRQALKSRGKELQGVVEESRRDQQALEALTRQLGQALAARQEQQVQDTIQQLFQLHMRRQGLKV